MASGPEALHAEPFEGLDGLRAAEPFWRELLHAADVDPLCNAPEWVLPHAAAYSAPGSLFGWTVSDREGAAIALFAFRVEPRRGAFTLRRALLVADGSAESDYLDLPVRRGHEHAAAALCLDLLARRRGIDAVLLSCVPTGSKLLAALRAELARRDLRRREVDVPCLAAELPSTFDDYVKSLKSRVRSKVRSAMRGAEEQGAEFQWCHDRADLDRHLAGLMELHEERWREAGEPGSFANDRRRAFYSLVWPDLLARGALRFCRLDVAGEPVAYQIGAVAGDTYYQVQEGYRPEHAGARVATALRGLAIQRMIEEGLRRYDFMAGDSRHKRDWGGEPRPCVSVAFALPRLRARLAYGARELVDRLRARRAARDEGAQVGG